MNVCVVELPAYWLYAFFSKEEASRFMDELAEPELDNVALWDMFGQDYP